MLKISLYTNWNVTITIKSTVPQSYLEAGISTAADQIRRSRGSPRYKRFASHPTHIYVIERLWFSLDLGRRNVSRPIELADSYGISSPGWTVFVEFAISFLQSV